jgi:hypothetical protein
VFFSVYWKEEQLSTARYDTGTHVFLLCFSRLQGGQFISEGGYKLLAFSLRHNIYLREIFLYNTNLNYGGMLALTEALKDNRELLAKPFHRLPWPDLNARGGALRTRMGCVAESVTMPSPYGPL